MRPDRSPDRVDRCAKGSDHPIVRYPPHSYPRYQLHQ